MGESFRVQIYGEDLGATSPTNKFGVYEASLDLAYSDPALFSMDGTKPDNVTDLTTFRSFFTASEFYFGPDEGLRVFRSVQDVDADSVPDEFDELQTFAISTKGIGKGAKPFVYTTLLADSVGKLTFSLNESDFQDPPSGPPTPLNDILVFDIDDPIDPEAVDFGNLLHVTIVQPVNAVDDAFPVSPNEIFEDGGAVNLNVLANDFQGTNSTGTLALEPTLLTQPTNGAVAIVGSQIRYTPNANFWGTDTFTYGAKDGSDNTDTATVTVTVTSVNDPPVATNDTATVEEDSVANVINVLGNDNGGPANEDQTLTIEVVSQPQHGAVTLVNSNTLVQYTPVGNYFGPDSFTYRAVDSLGAKSEVKTVSITVTNKNDADPAERSGHGGGGRLQQPDQRVGERQAGAGGRR